MKSSTVPTLPRVISLNVGGYKFVTTLSTLTKDSNSMLAAMFSGRHHLNTDSEGRYFIDRDGSYFEHILNFLRDSSHLPSPNIALEVRNVCFRGREGLVNRVYGEDSSQQRKKPYLTQLAAVRLIDSSYLCNSTGTLPPPFPRKIFFLYKRQPFRKKYCHVLTGVFRFAAGHASLSFPYTSFQP